MTRLSSVAERRVQIGLALQPFVAAVLEFVLFPVLARTHAGRTVDAFETAIAIGVLTGIAGLLITICAAYPALTHLTKHRRLTAGQTILAGAAFGNIPAAISIVAIVLVQRGSLPDAVAGNWRAVLFGAFIGAVCAAVFWWVGGRHIAAGSLADRDPAGER